MTRNYPQFIYVTLLIPQLLRARSQTFANYFAYNEITL